MLVQLRVVTEVNSSASGTVVLRIKRQEAALDQFKEYDVQLLPAA